MRGVALDANNPSARPSVRRLKKMGCDGVRLVASPTVAFARYMKSLHDGGLGVALVLTSDSYSTEEYAIETGRYVSTYPYVDIFCVGNEWNMQPPGAASWPTTPADLATLWRTVAPVLPDGKRYVGGYFMVDDAPLSLLHVLGGLDPLPDGVDLHPYLDTIPTFEETVTELQEESYEVSCCEWNDSTTKGIHTFQATLDALDLTASMFLPWAGPLPATDNLPGLVSPRTGRLTRLGIAYASSLAVR